MFVRAYRRNWLALGVLHTLLYMLLTHTPRGTLARAGSHANATGLHTNTNSSINAHTHCT